MTHFEGKSKRGLSFDDLKLTYEQFEEYYFEIFPKLADYAAESGVKINLIPLFPGLKRLPLEQKIKMLRENRTRYSEMLKDYAEGFYGKIPFSNNPCHLLEGYLDIQTEGSVLPCCFVGTEMSFGNINKESLVAIWQRHIKRLPNLQVPFDEVCLRCKNFR